MDIEHRLELLVAHLVDDSVPRVAGIVDDHVNGTVRVQRRLHDPGRQIRVRHAPDTRSDLAAACTDFGGGFFGGIGVKVVHDNPGAVLREELGNRLADAAARTGDDCGPAFKQFHTLAIIERWEAEPRASPGRRASGRRMSVRGCVSDGCDPSGSAARAGMPPDGAAHPPTLLAAPLLVVRSPRAGRSEEELPPVLKRHVASVGPVRAILRLVTVDDHHLADLDRVALEAAVAAGCSGCRPRPSRLPSRHRPW